MKFIHVLCIYLTKRHAAYTRDHQSIHKLFSNYRTKLNLKSSTFFLQLRVSKVVWKTFHQPTSNKYTLGVAPSQDSSDHQDYHIFRIGVSYKSSFGAVAGREPHPKYTIQLDCLQEVVVSFVLRLYRASIKDMVAALPAALRGVLATGICIPSCRLYKHD